MNKRTIACPKCRRPGQLYAIRSLHALVGSRHIAHVLHVTGDGETRHMCLLTRSETQRVADQYDGTERSSYGW